MSEKSGDEKENEATSEKQSEKPEKNQKLDDAISRLLRRKAPADGQEGDNSVH